MRKPKEKHGDSKKTRKRWPRLLLAAAFFAGLWAWKARQTKKRLPSFEELYYDVPADKKEQLLQFRETHPYKRLTVNGVEWEYIAAGQGQQALLLLGGAMATGEANFQRILELEDHLRIISPSYPAVGRMGPVADGLAAILEAEGIPRAHVFGHSLGAGVAHCFVRRHPDRVDRLVLSSFGLYNERNLEMGKRFVRLMELLPYGFTRTYYTWRMKQLLGQAPGQDAAFWQAYTQDLFLLQHSKDSLLGQFKLLVDTFEHADEYRVYEPLEKAGHVLLIAAADDTGFEPSERETLKSLYPGIQVHLFEQGGHLASTSHREEYDAALYDFLGLPPVETV